MVHQIALIDRPNMSNLGHRSKKVYGSIPSIEAQHENVHSSVRQVSRSRHLRLPTKVAIREFTIRPTARCAYAWHRFAEGTERCESPSTIRRTLCDV